MDDKKRKQTSYKLILGQRDGIGKKKEMVIMVGMSIKNILAVGKSCL